MTDVHGSADCGNSPKNAFAQDVSVALATGDTGFLDDRVTDDVRWEVTGRSVIEGERALKAALDEAREKPPLEMRVHHAISHGKVAAVNGALVYADGRREFCDVLEFANTKGTRVSAITSYVHDTHT